MWCTILNLSWSVCLCLIASQWTTAEVYTALADLEDLLQTEAELIKTLEGYIAQQEMKLATLKRQVTHYAEEHEKANRDPTDYLANPINAYLLVKRLTTDWKSTEEVLQYDFQKEILENLTRLKDEVKFPTDEDLNGAAIALTRLQDTYNLDTKSLASGELNGIKYSTQLTSDDCFELGRQAYYNEDFYHTVLWMQESLRKYELEKNDKSILKWEILEYLAFSLFKEGRIHAAYELTRELLSVFPNHARAKGNLEYYESVLENEGKSEKKKGDDGARLDNNEFENSQMDDATKPLTAGERAKYEMLCRKDLTLSPGESSKLKCRYVHKNNAFLLIAPLKEEQMYPNPNIVVYHEVIYPEEIEVIKRIATPRLQRATVQNHKTGALEAANYRISKSAWLKEDDHKYVANIRKRVEDITSLSVETAEELQVVNYGIGGHYEPHFDFARKEETNAFKSLGTGNRIATVLFYMSDVAQGGATVFPLLNLALWPEKGSAAFWLNLHSSGSGNHLTRHAACPVLQGSKWGCFISSFDEAYSSDTVAVHVSLTAYRYSATYRVGVETDRDRALFDVVGGCSFRLPGKRLKLSEMSPTGMFRARVILAILLD